MALFLVDQRMPGMTGLELLREVTLLHPGARKVLLTAYADTEVAIAGINEIALDHYLMKPWDPPDQRLYPVLDDLLSEWRARSTPSFDGIRVMGSEWSPASFEGGGPSNSTRCSTPRARRIWRHSSRRDRGLKREPSPTGS